MAAADPLVPTDTVLATRSEEVLHLGTTRRAVERLRLRKVVVTEEVTITVPVRREEFRLERFPADEHDSPAAQPQDPDQVGETLLHEFVLREEVPVVQMRVIARERVRVTKTVRTDHVEVAEQLRKERIQTTLESTSQPGD